MLMIMFLTTADFSSVKCPEGFNKEEKRNFYKDLAASWAHSTATLLTTKNKDPKISLRDISDQRKRDIVPIDPPIKDSPDSFIDGLFAFRRAREQLRGWYGATYMKTYTPTTDTEPNDSDEDYEDKTKWHSKDIDLFADFEKISPGPIRDIAESIWDNDAAFIKAQDGQSDEYVRKAFSEFLFASMSPELQKKIQYAVKPQGLWNDGPYVWVTLVHLFFPSAAVLRTTLLDRMKSATLAKSDYDLSVYTHMLKDIQAIVDTESHVEDLVTYFVHQTNTHPSELIRNHFRMKGCNFFIQSIEERPSFDDFLSDADRLHTLVTSTALPFGPTDNDSSKNTKNIAALAGVVKNGFGHVKKLVGYVSQIDNKVSQGSESAKNRSNASSSAKAYRPTWLHEAPTDPDEVKEFNGKPWFWCASCNKEKGQWSTSHCTAGREYNGKTIHKHDGKSPHDRKHSERNSSGYASKKAKTENSKPITGMKSLKAAISSINNDSILGPLIAKGAGWK